MAKIKCVQHRELGDITQIITLSASILKMVKRFASHTDDEIFKKGSKVYSNSDLKGSKFTTAIFS
jgi:hypothetical protein